MKISWCSLVTLILCFSVSTAFPNDMPFGCGGIASNSVEVGPTRVAVPLCKFLLIRKGSEYCAIRFMEAFDEGYGLYKGKPVEAFARYEVYYQGDGSGDFLNKNTQHASKNLIIPLKFGFWSKLIGPKRNVQIECGPYELAWGTGTVVHFFRRPDDQDHPASIKRYGIELSPTLWSQIGEVNVQDPRLRWYRYDESRQEQVLLPNEVWSERERGGAGRKDGATSGVGQPAKNP